MFRFVWDMSRKNRTDAINSSDFRVGLWLIFTAASLRYNWDTLRKYFGSSTGITELCPPSHPLLPTGSSCQKELQGCKHSQEWNPSLACREPWVCALAFWERKGRKWGRKGRAKEGGSLCFRYHPSTTPPVLSSH